MTVICADPSEERDAKLVDEALELFRKKQLERSKHLATQVALRTPPAYSSQRLIPNGGEAIKFWDQAAFVAYCAWQRRQGLNEAAAWTPNAYPRAHFLLGRIAMTEGDHDEAIAQFEQGQRLEPENPRFALERSEALVGLGDLDEAFMGFASVSECGPFVGHHELAHALRGLSFIFAEWGDVDQAEAACVRANRLDPRNSLSVAQLTQLHAERRRPPAPGQPLDRPTAALGC